jgi:hypothetical protein
MGILSGLLKIGGLAAAPFTAGGSLALTGAGGLLDSVGKAGQVAGGQQAGANNARVAQGQLDLARDRNVLDLYGQQQGAQFTAGQQDLARKNYELDSRNRNAKTALIASLLNGGLPSTSIAGGKASGGLAEKLRTDPGAMAAMRNLAEQSDKAQMAPMDWSKVYTYQGGNLVDAPTLSAPQKIDIGNKGIGNILTKIAQLAGAFGGGGEDNPVLPGVNIGKPTIPGRPR